MDYVLVMDRLSHTTMHTPLIQTLEATNHNQCPLELTLNHIQFVYSLNRNRKIHGKILNNLTNCNGYNQKIDEDKNNYEI